MKRVVQSLRTGKLSLAAIPEPVAQKGQVVIANGCSVISAGTEKAAMELAQKSLLGKAKERPDQVRRVLEKVRNEGVFNTFRAVSARLDEPLSMGYSSAGTVLAVGAGVEGIRPGDRVASNGPHGEIVAVPKNLCALIPGSVPFDRAAFAVLGAIALQGVRLAKLELGETAYVIGLGLIGQLTVALLRAAGIRVLARDLDSSRCELAVRMGADEASTSLTAPVVEELTNGIGADAVLVTAATDSNGPIEESVRAVRKKGRIVLVGVAGLHLDRRPFFFKECEFVVSSSYGPGRYDPVYEERGHDYPLPYVRWTEQRNIAAVLSMMASGRLDVTPLISHRFSVEMALAAYELIESGREPFMGILLEYPGVSQPRPATAKLTPGPVSNEKIGIGCLGAGNFARTVLLPAVAKSSVLEPVLLCSAGGLSAGQSAERLGFPSVTSSEEDVYNDPRIRAVFVLTRHDQHGAQVEKALRAKKAVFVEKPLCLTLEELERIERALEESPSLLVVGFNRRFSPAARMVKEFFADTTAPLTVSVRFNAGPIPPEHWTQDEEIGGGRILGEACHAIDLATFLTGSVPVRVFADCVGGASAPSITSDQAFLTVRHENGSLSSIAYLAGGDKAFPKERIEVFGGGKVAVIDDFKKVSLVSSGRSQEKSLASQDKGHSAEVKLFADALSGHGSPPFSWAELRSVTLAGILAVRSLREGFAFEIPA
jgi:predicted dehydrogenase/threonine dehydrogenase-like Zn-dependent dehydrogenase